MVLGQRDHSSGMEGSIFHKITTDVCIRIDVVDGVITAGERHYARMDIVRGGAALKHSLICKPAPSGASNPVNECQKPERGSK